MSCAPIYSEQIPTKRVPSSVNNNLISKKSSRNSKSARRRISTAAENSPLGGQPIIVHCHLCWDWVWQRPQQFLSRLSKQHRILFIETIRPDPELAAPLARFKNLEAFPQITVLTIQFPSWCWNDGEFVDRERRRLVKNFISGPMAGHFEYPIQWFYDPMAVPAFLGQMDEVLTVYDCMDELSKFACAPPQLVERELELLERADVVFTGGRKLFESKRQLNDNCHFYGCGVDGEHFGKARLPETDVPADIARLPRPVLGYFGVIDERMDYELIASLADSNPGWSVAMVGPVLKVDESSLPRRNNLHWLGKRDYRELPALCKGFDVCLMPFALNESTEYINPTKALEYMATGRAIVSTAVPDVVSNFASAVQIASSKEDFIRVCREVLETPPLAAIQRGLELVADNSWEAIVARLEEHIQTALTRKRITV